MKKDEKKITEGYIALIVVSFFWGTINSFEDRRATYAGVVCFRRTPVYFRLNNGKFFFIERISVPTKSDLGKIFLQGIFLLCIANGLLTWSLEYISSGSAAIIAALVPLFIALFSIGFLNAQR